MNSLKIALMSSITEASYARFPQDLSNQDAIVEALIEARISPKQVDNFLRTVTALNHRPNVESGFSASLFQEKGITVNSEFILAIRGTEPVVQGGVDLISADIGGLVLEGAALFQIVDLYNYWKQLTANAGAVVRLARISGTNDPLASGLFAAVTLPALPTSFRRIEFFDQPGAGLGVITGPVSNVTVTGHSLGGHLATAFQRLFPSVVGEVFTVNGAGTRGSEMVDRFFDALAGRAGTSFNPARISNLYGSSGPNVVSGELVYSQIGSRGELFTESIMDVGGHGNKQMTDSAAVYDLFIRTDDRLKTQTASQLGTSLLGLFKAADAEAGYTLEAVVNTFGRLFLPGYTPISRTLADDRDGLHERIIAIRQVLPAASSELSIASLVGKSADELTVLAGTDIAYRYALRELNSFAVLGADYAMHNIGGGLDAFDGVTGRGLTDEWIAARAQMLSALADYNTADGAVNANAIAAHFDDRASGVAFGPLANTTPRLVFGRDDQALVVAGSAVGDRFFGAAADDSLTGNAGNDHLEGGHGADVLDGGFGNDVLLGGAGDDTLIAGDGIDVLDGGYGFDTYHAGLDFGAVVIRDADGSGRLFFDGAEVTGGIRQSGNDYRTTDGLYKLSLVGDVNTSATLIIGDNVRVEAFHNGDLGIFLDGADDAEPPVGAYAYSRYTFPDNITLDPEDPAIGGLFSGSYANDTFAPGAVDFANTAIGKDLDREDAINIFGKHYRGWGGDDVYHGSYHYSDIFHGDGGDDVIYGSELGIAYVPFEGAGDADTLYGGGGRDTIVGGKGDDALYGDFQSSALRVFTVAGWPNFEGYGGPDPVDLADLFTLSLDDWTAVWNPAPSVSAEGRWESPQGGVFDDANGLGFEAALRDYLGLRGDVDIANFYDDYVSGGRGNDRIFGGFGSDTLVGGEGDDVMDADSRGIRPERIPLVLRPLFGEVGDDFMDGGDGKDTLIDRLGGNDAMYGGPGDDDITNIDPLAESGDDAARNYSNYLSGGDGNDTLISFNGSLAGFDRVDGGDGDDVVSVGGYQGFGAGYVEVFGGNGDDAIGVGSPVGYVDGGAGNDTIDVEYEDYDVEAGEQNDTGAMRVSGGGGDDVITAAGPVDVDGGDGDDVIEWVSAYGQTVGGVLRGGAGDDDITASGPVNIDAGSGDDSIHITAAAGRIVGGGGTDRITVGSFGDVVSNIVLDADASDELVFEHAPFDGVPPSALKMERAGNDLLLSLVATTKGAADVVQANVRIEDWFQGDADQLASIRVEGLRSWTPQEVAGVIAESTPVAGPVDAAADVVDPGEPISDAPSTRTAPVSIAAVSAVPEFAAATPSEIVVAPQTTVGAAAVTAVAVVKAALSDDEGDLAEASGDDPVSAFLAQLADKREADGSFDRTPQLRVATSDAPTPSDPARADRIAREWNALHAYMDTLADAADTDQIYAARTDRLFGQMAITGNWGAGVFGAGVSDAASLGIRDRSLADLRPLQSLSEGFTALL